MPGVDGKIAPQDWQEYLFDPPLSFRLVSLTFALPKISISKKLHIGRVMVFGKPLIPLSSSTPVTKHISSKLDIRQSIGHISVTPSGKIKENLIQPIDIRMKSKTIVELDIPYQLVTHSPFLALSLKITMNLGCWFPSDL